MNGKWATTGWDRHQRMMESCGTHAGDSQNPNVWYAGGYYVGYIDSAHTPPADTPEHFLDLWYQGREDGRGDRNEG